SVWAGAFGILLLAGARAAVAQAGNHVSKSAVTVVNSTLNKASPNGDVSSSSLVRNAAGGATKKVVGSEGEKGEGEMRRGQEGERREVKRDQGGGAEGREEEEEEEEEREGAEEEAEMGQAYRRWVEKPASLNVPLRVVALRGTVASMWRKAVPATARYNIPKAAWRNRGPSPLIGQWMKFCLQPARAVPLEQEIFSAFSPTVLPDCLPLAPMQPADTSSINAASTGDNSTKGSTSRATNTSNSNKSTTTTTTTAANSSSGSARGLPAAAILAASEFVEPLNGATQAELNCVLLGDKKWGVGAQGQSMQGLVKRALEAVGLALDKLRRRE
ncbi:unnamed protein product, partial [Closterium sp. NIES-54]